MSARSKSPTRRGTGPTKVQTPPDDQLDNQKTAIYDSGNFKKEAATPIKAISMKTKPGVEAISMKTPSAEKIPTDGVDARPKPKVKMRALSEVVAAPPAQDLGRLAPPRDAKTARQRRLQDYILWGSVSVILASVIALIIWFVAR